MRPSPINVPPDRFTRLEQVDERDGRLIFRVSALAVEAFTASVGDLVEVDPNSRAADFQSEFAVLTSAGVVLAGLGPLHGRPRDGGSGLTLRPKWRDDADIDELLSPAQFAQACIGRRVEAAEASAREPISEELWAEIDRARADEQRLDADRDGARLAAARAAGWRAPPVNNHLSESPPREPTNLHGPEGTFDIDRITRKLLDAGRIKNAFAHRTGNATSTFVQVRAMVWGSAGLAYKLAKARAEEWPQAKADRRQINENLRSIAGELEGFLRHIGIGDAGLFIDFDASVPEDEDRPLHFLLHAAEDDVAKAQAQAKSLLKTIQHLERTFQEPESSRDGRKDHLASEFVKEIASA
ncbi:hypothetical protein [Methylobacterium sp. Leaf123]|uniref:hypothetical protein n=1 Tax=Methylobacterium sp. Leaf123 TaxID=1736264 RepID=UPI000A7BF706|nr:hypothetical protein [Methylobacterium sp. Leaf123]